MEREEGGSGVTKSLISLTVMRFLPLQKSVENGKLAAANIKEIAPHQIQAKVVQSGPSCSALISHNISYDYRENGLNSPGSIQLNDKFLSYLLDLNLSCIGVK